MGFDQRRMAPGNDTSPYSPLNDAPYAWWDAALSTLYSDAGTTIVTANDSSVLRWSDLSGNARHLDAAGDSNRATLKTSIINGYPVLRFDGTDDVLSVASLAISTFAIIAVIDSNADQRMAYCHGANGSTDDGCVLMSQQGATYTAVRTTKNGKNITDATWANSPVVACHRHEGTDASHVVSLNGSDAAATSHGAGWDNDVGTGTATKTFYVGGRGSGGLRWSGDIHAICILTPYSAAAMARVIDYYRTRLAL